MARGARPKSLPAKTSAYVVEILGRRFPVQDIVEASRLVEAVRDRSGAGASEMGGEFPIYEDGRMIGYVSYNGKVWRGDPERWREAQLMYDPYAADQGPRTVEARVLSGTSELTLLDALAEPGMERAVEAVIQSATRQGVSVISAKNSYIAVTRKTDILDDARVSGDKWLLKLYGIALADRAARLGIEVIDRSW